jgi:hypothetical protein
VIKLIISEDIMKKTLMFIAVSLIAVSLYAVSLAGASTFTVYGSGDPTEYGVTRDGITFVTPVAVTTLAEPWRKPGSWMTYNNPDQSWPMDSGSGSLPGTYNYVTMFDLTGLDPSTAIITGSWASDNGAKLYFNDEHKYNPVSTIGETGYRDLTLFTISSGFVAGENWLMFEVTNDPWGPDPYINPTGLLVNIDSSTADPVPEPSTLLLLGAGLIGFGFMRRRAKN